MIPPDMMVFNILSNYRNQDTLLSVKTFAPGRHIPCIDSKLPEKPAILGKKTGYNVQIAMGSGRNRQKRLKSG
jgi:hypothetical protein